MKLEIRSNKEGSFETIIEAIATYANSLFTRENISFAGNIVQGYVNFFQIKAHLKGKEAKKIETKEDKTAIVNQENEVITIPSNTAHAYFTNATVNSCIINIGNGFKEAKIDSFEVEHKEKIVFIPKEDFNMMSAPL